jgi:hypothetical protein
MAEYSRLAKGNFAAVGTSQYIPLPFQPDYVEIWNYTNIKTAAANTVTRAWWDSKFIDTATNNNATMIEIYNNSTAVVFDTIQTNGISAYSGGLSFQFGPIYQHTGSTDFSIAKSSAGGPTTVTTTSNHNLVSGDVVIFSNLVQTSTTGMQQIAGMPFVITRLSGTTFSFPWDTSGSNYTAFNTATATNNVGSWKQVLYPALYAPNVALISGVTLGATTIIALTTPGNFQVGQEIAFRIPNNWGPTQLNSLPNNAIPGSPIYGYVTAVSASLTTPTITVNINSVGYTAFNANQLYASYPGEKFPQVAAVGDINTGGNLYSGGALYPSPQFWNGNSSALSSSVNGPAILGAFCNNTSQGFVIGPGVANIDTSAAVTIMASGNQIYYHAYAHDYGNP